MSIHLPTHWIFTGCDQTQQDALVQHWNERQEGLWGKLDELPEPARELQVHVSFDSDDELWRTQAALHMPSQVLAAEAERPNFDASLDEAMNGLSLQAETYREQQEQPPASDLPQIEDLLERNFERGNSRAFLELLRPVVGSFAAFARQELQELEDGQVLTSGRVTVEDVLDETLLESWEKFSHRNLGQPLRVWLIGVIRETADRLAKATTEEPPTAAPAEEHVESLEERQREPSPTPRDADRSNWTDFAAYRDSIALAGLLPDGPGQPWRETEVDTHRDELAAALDELPRLQRQALVLSGVAGFEVGVIADVQGRTAEEVRGDLQAGREALRQQVSAG